MGTVRFNAWREPVKDCAEVCGPDNELFPIEPWARSEVEEGIGEVAATGGTRTCWVEWDARLGTPPVLEKDVLVEDILEAEETEPPGTLLLGTLPIPVVLLGVDTEGGTECAVYAFDLCRLDVEEGVEDTEGVVGVEVVEGIVGVEGAEGVAVEGLEADTEAGKDCGIAVEELE